MRDRAWESAWSGKSNAPGFRERLHARASALDIDTRADVYALGVLLYELLTGTTPLDPKRLRTAAYSEIVRLIREAEPPRPSTRLTQSKESLANLSVQRRTDPARLTREVRGELDWIVMKCLEKDRTRRYERREAGSLISASPPDVPSIGPAAPAKNITGDSETRKK